MSALIRTFALVACAAVLAVPAFAGGDDYDAASDAEGKGPAYFGFVRDTRGLPVADASVTLSAKGGQPLVCLTVYTTPMARLLAPGARVVLSGLLTSQASAALATYRNEGLALEHRIVLDGWSTLVLRRDRT